MPRLSYPSINARLRRLEKNVNFLPYKKLIAESNLILKNIGKLSPKIVSNYENSITKMFKNYCQL